METRQQDPSSVKVYQLPRTRRCTKGTDGCYLGYGTFWGVYAGPGKLDKLIKYAQCHNLILGEKLCSTCGAQCHLDTETECFVCDKYYITGDNNSKQRCTTKVSIFLGTWFERNKSDIETSLKFALLFVQDFFSYATARIELSLSDVAIHDLDFSCREVLISWSLGQTKKIGGEGKSVEIVESQFGRRIGSKYNYRRAITCQFVYGGICRKTHECFVIPVENCSSETLLTIIQNYIEPKTKIISNCWRAYDCLSDERYTQLKENYSINFVNLGIDTRTDTVEECQNKKNPITKNERRIIRRKRQYIGSLAASFFKLCYTNGTHRLHAFCEAAAALYPPSP